MLENRQCIASHQSLSSQNDYLSWPADTISHASDTSYRFILPNDHRPNGQSNAPYSCQHASLCIANLDPTSIERSLAIVLLAVLFLLHSSAALRTTKHLTHASQIHPSFSLLPLDSFLNALHPHRFSCLILLQNPAPRPSIIDLA